MLARTDLGLYDYEGHPISVKEWERLMLARKPGGEWCIGREAVGDCHVSTVWTGVDQGMSNDRAPLIFETMVFALDGEQWQWTGVCVRYTSAEEARAGHAKLVAALRAEETQ